MSDPTLENLIALLADYACVPEESIVLEAPLTDIGLDSLDHVKLLLEIEEHFQVELPETAFDLTTAQSLYQAILAA
jgi:acyl carrier protein